MKPSSPQSRFQVGSESLAFPNSLVLSAATAWMKRVCSAWKLLSSKSLWSTPSNRKPLSSRPSRVRLYSDGISSRLARSPAAPNTTIRHGGAAEGLAGAGDALAAFGRFDMAAEPEPHGREELLAERVLDPGAEAGIERRRQHLGRHRLLDRGCLLYTSDAA